MVLAVDLVDFYVSQFNLIRQMPHASAMRLLIHSYPYLFEILLNAARSYGLPCVCNLKCNNTIISKFAKAD